MHPAMTLAPLPIELAVVGAFLASPHPDAIEVTILERRFTGAGLYTTFTVNASLRPRAAGEKGPLRGPEIASPDIENGAGSLLWPGDDGVHTLEVFTYTHPLPEALSSFELTP